MIDHNVSFLDSGYIYWSSFPWWIKTFVADDGIRDDAPTVTCSFSWDDGDMQYQSNKFFLGSVADTKTFEPSTSRYVHSSHHF